MKRITEFFNKEKKSVKDVSENVEASEVASFSTDNAGRPNFSSSRLNCQISDTSHSLDLGTLLSGPIRPKLASYPMTKFGKQNRSFSKSFYEKYDWLEYSIKQDAVFCFLCRNFGMNSSYEEEVFTKTGFKNWKHITEKLHKHASCVTHNTCLEKSRMSEQTATTGSVMTQLSTAHQQEVMTNVNYLKKVVEIITYLTTQGLALRGHDEKEDSDNRGNFLELCSFFSKHDSLFDERFQKTKGFCSKTIQNEIIEIISSQLKEKILQEIKLAGVFSIMIDEARCFKEQQLSFCVRYVDDQLTPHERFLFFKDCSAGRDAGQLANIVIDILKELNIDGLSVVAQTYDGASVMSGKHAGLQAKVRQVYPEAVYFHCYAHKVALVVTDVCKIIESSSLLFNGLEALYVHFSRPSNHAILKSTAEKLQINKSFEISAQSSTRWTCRYTNCEQLIKNYDAVSDALQYEIDKCEDTNSIEAVGILSTIQSPRFVVNLFVFHDILSLTHVLSKTLQHEECTLGGASQIIRSTLEALKEKRSDIEFSAKWKHISEFAENHDICLENIRGSKRKRQQNVLLKDSMVMSKCGRSEADMEYPESESAEMYWKSHVYFRVLDVVIERLSERFSEESLALADAVDGLFNLDFKKSEIFRETYTRVLKINSSLLEAEITIAKKCVDKELLDAETPNEHISTKPGKKAKVPFKFELLRKTVEKQTFPNLFKCLQVAATIPISSASCERSFSAMRRVKNWLRTSMKQERLSNLSLLYIEKKKLKETVSSEDIVRIFAMKPRKLHLV